MTDITSESQSHKKIGKLTRFPFLLIFSIEKRSRMRGSYFLLYSVFPVCGSLPLLSSCGLEGWQLDVCSVLSLQQRPFLQCTSDGICNIQGRSQQSSRLALCSHAQARSTSPCSSCAPSCTSSTSPKGSCES